MTISPQAARAHLRDFELRALFVEELGWDHHRTQPLDVQVNGATYRLSAVAQKRGMVVYTCAPGADGAVPDHATQRKIEKAVAHVAYEHIIVYADAAHGKQVWQWVRREPNQPDRYRQHIYYAGHSGESLLQRLQHLAISIDEEDDLDVTAVAGRARRAFDVDRVTRRFYERFQAEHSAFLAFIQGMQSQADRAWYASLMLNRLMFIYFIQKKGFLDPNDGSPDGQSDYLRNRLRHVRARRGQGSFHSFYRHFLLRLFHEGLGGRARSSELDELLGTVPYLNGGLFDVHELERENSGIAIPDEAFERIFDFFDEFHWHLDDRPLRADDEINPDVLGYIFEKYINQKQMGAYYTKEDITEYIGKSTIIPYLFDAAEKSCAIALRPDGALWNLLRDDPDRYIHGAVRHGVDLPLPPEIAAGEHDVARREGWNRPAPAEYALPTETWREHMARRARCHDLRARLAAGEVTRIDALVTHNLDLRQLAQDAIRTCEGPELLRAFYKAIESVTVLDPTCGSGAFLFAALNILQPLYEACLDRMAAFVDELDGAPAHDGDGAAPSARKFSDFRAILARVERHPNRAYFILKSIIVNNLYGVDIMAEAVEICKLRLFLKLVAQVQRAAQIEPLPDVDFNIRAGNTLVGFARYDEVQTAVRGGLQMKMDLEGDMERIDERAALADRAFRLFHTMQTEHEMAAGDFTGAKAELRGQLAALSDELDRYLAREYGLEISPPEAPLDLVQWQEFEQWRASHQPFHWFTEFYGIMHGGGFDVIIGNPPYLEKSKLAGTYRPYSMRTGDAKDIYAWVVERTLALRQGSGKLGLIIPVSFASSGSFNCLRDVVWDSQPTLWLSHFANRPGQLFSGAQNRLTIMLCQSSKGSTTTFSTRYHRWSAREGERESLFQVLQYVQLNEPVRGFHGLFPKIGTPEARNIFHKLESRRLLKEHLTAIGTRLVYWVRVPGYFCQFFLEPPKARPEKGGPDRVRGEVNSLTASDERTQKALHSILNSSTYYQFFCAYTDGRHINPSDVHDFPLDLKAYDSATISLLSGLSEQLAADMMANTTQSRKSGLLIDSVDSKPCKPIIDEIDRVLARHYGFTAEELDFIINYDVKYRMGQGAGDEE